jgi:Catalase
MSGPDIARTVPDATAAGEIVPPGEDEASRIIVRAIEDKVRAAAKSGPARRDAHPKAHGCLQAEFRVLDGLPPALRVGVFAESKAFKAWIRFSNGSDTPQPDSVGDGRGMAIKLMGIAQSPSTTQDFLMINHPVFFVRNAADYVDFQTAPSLWRFFFPGLNPFRFRLHELSCARGIAGQTVLNPLNVRYWSMTPYGFGGGACKFSARPAGTPSRFTATDVPDFLRANLARHLAETSASFDFMVQLRAQPDTMPIEDPTIIWNEDAAPFVPVARITIPPQSFDSPAQHAFCENLSFTPWHCVDAHRPLGGINRLRRTVYEAISGLRHDLNAAPRREPTDFTL